MSSTRLAACIALCLTVASLGGAAAAAGAKPATAASSENESWRYTVQPGDTLIEIARQHLNALPRWRDVQRLNNIRDPRRLRPGSVLVIPLAITKVQAAAARVVAVTGEVQVMRAGAAQAASPGQLLQPGDELLASANANAALEFADGSRARVLSDSHVQFKRLQRIGADGPVSTQIELKRGRIESSVAKQPGGKPNYLINTPSIQLGVRGTEFRAAADAPDTARTEVLEGLVDAANALGRTDVAAGFGTLARAGEAPQPPRPLLPATNLSTIPAQVFDRLPYALAWPAVPGAQRYRVQIARAADFNQLLADELLTGAQLDFARDLPEGDYAVRVRAIDALGLEGADASSTLRVRAPLLPVSYNVTRDALELAWAAPAQASGQYLWQLALDDRFVELMHEQLVDGPTLSLPRPPEGDYYARVIEAAAAPARAARAVRVEVPSLWPWCCSP